MSRRHRAEKRDVLPDAKFKDEIVSKFMSCLMYDGKGPQQNRLFMERLIKLNLEWDSNQLRFSMRLSTM